MMTFEEILQRVRNTPHEDIFVKIMQHLLTLSQKDGKIEDISREWESLEKMISEAVKNQDGNHEDTTGGKRENSLRVSFAQDESPEAVTAPPIPAVETRCGQRGNFLLFAFSQLVCPSTEQPF